MTGHYRLDQQTNSAKSTVVEFSLSFPSENGETNRWIQLEAHKASGDRFRVWLLTSGYPPASLVEAKRSIIRYILQEGSAQASEFRD